MNSIIGLLAVLFVFSLNQCSIGGSSAEARVLHRRPVVVHRIVVPHRHVRPIPKPFHVPNRRCLSCH